MVFNEQNLYKTIYLQLGAILIFQPLEENIDSYVNKLIKMSFLFVESVMSFPESRAL